MVGIDGAKFRRPVVPGDELRLAITVLHRRGALCRVKGEITLGEHRVAEAKLLLQVEELAAPEVDPTARVAPGAILGPGVRVGAYCVIGPRVRLGTRTVLESQVTIAGDTTLGEDNQVFPFASLGHRPQDLKYHGEDTKLVIGDRNTFREGVTVHRGTEGGGGITRIGSDNLFMAQVHVAHDCRVGNHTIFANAAALSGHVEVQDWATLGGFAGVHQFCRVGAHAFMGGATIATKDVLPFSMTVGNRARIFGLNLIGLRRRGFSAEALSALKQAFRVLVQSRLNTTQALALLQAEGPHTPEVGELVTFIRESKRGVVLRRRQGSTSDLDES